MNYNTIFHPNSLGSALRIALPNNLRLGKVIKTTDAQHGHQWAVWNLSSNGEKVIRAFGTSSSESQSGYVYIGVNSDNELILTESINKPTESDIAAEDNRLFYYHTNLHQRENILEHVKTKMFVTMRLNSSGRPIHTLILTDNVEQARKWEFAGSNSTFGL